MYFLLSNRLKLCDTSIAIISKLISIETRVNGRLNRRRGGYYSISWCEKG